MARMTFTVNTEPHVAELGDGIELKFLPEVTGALILQARSYMNDMQKLDRTKLEGDVLDEEYVQKAAQSAEVALRGFVDTLLLDEDERSKFAKLALNEGTLMQIQSWLMEVYGQRPTMPSSDSSASSDETTTSDSSTADSSPVE